MKKRLVFCFDGTWNKLDAPCPTNVVLTAESVLPLASDEIAQLIFYDEGVGTTRSEVIRGGMFGQGLVRNLADGYRFLIFNYTPGDEIYIFGFSRGAYTARSFAGLLSNCGILLRRHANKVDEAIDLYRSRRATPPAEYTERMMRWRRDHSPYVCVSQEEDDWRVQRVSGYTAGKAPRLYVTYIGVWDTVGALGIPSMFGISTWINRRHQFHDHDLSPFVVSGRHAVAINERRRPFEPTLWKNIDDLNVRAGTTTGADDSRYQQVWFPGTHSSVGGGGDRRGLSDQALHWIWEGAMLMGLELDTDERSLIYEIAPNYTEYLEDTAEPPFSYRAMNWFGKDRVPGPEHIYEVSSSAQRRWHESADSLSDKRQYRPRTLARVAQRLDELNPDELGVGERYREALKTGKYKMYRVKQDDTLSAIAKRFYGDPKQYSRIFDANRDFIEHPNKIKAGQVIRLPRTGMIAEI